MGMDDEVLPDSQDEAELDTLDILISEFSPLSEQPSLPNASIPSLHTSSSFELPPPIPTNHTATSTISQYTTETILNTLPEKASAISAFTTSSSVKTSTSARRRPRPKPNYAGVDANDPIGDVHLPQDTSIEFSPTTRRVQGIQPEATFTADISERIKARRAKKDMESAGKVHDGVKKSDLAVEAVIVISSDDIMASEPSNFRSSTKRPRKHTDNSRPVTSLNVEGPAHDSSSLLHDASDRRNTSPTTPRNPSRDPLPNSNSVPLPLFVDRTNAEKPFESRNVQDPGIQPKRKKKRKVTDGSTGEPQVPEKASKRRSKVKEKGLKSSTANIMDKDTEKGPFKSSEFILDSDDELALGDECGSNKGTTAIAPTVPVSTTIVSLPVTKSSLSSEALGGSMPESLVAHDHELGLKLSTKKRPKKVAKQKRKSNAEQQDEALADTEDRPPPPKKVRRNDDSPQSRIAKEKPTVTSPIGPDIQHTTSFAEPEADGPDVVNDSRKTRKTKGRTVIEDDQYRGDAKENTDPLPKPPSTSTPVRVTKAPQKSDSDHNQYHAHPPKNRPLSAILQRVNGSSPRPRASPAISRSLLTRIVPLHPNRRTPPPPPPPRIVPKKTKKEIEREEKWEEELQETVEGWCELEEAEREKMRRAKRDWELGLCEE